MYLEHLVYSLAISLIVGMIYQKYTGRDPSWIIIIGTIFPDIDYILWRADYHFFGNPTLIIHGTFHTFVALAIASVIAGYYLMKKINLPFKHGALLFTIGGFAHFAEDMLVYENAYAFLAPFTYDKQGLGLIWEAGDLFHMAGSEVLIPGMCFVAVAAIIRSSYDENWSFMDGLYTKGAKFKYQLQVLLNMNIVMDEDE